MAAPNPQIPIEARQTVLDMIVANQSFTAYEITLEVRRRLGTSVEVPHPIVNPIVQTMFAQGEIMGYTRAPDASVNAANPPYRYSPQSAPVPATPQVAAPAVQLSPAILRANRTNRLPEALRFNDPIRAIMREYGLEARDFHLTAGTPDLPFDVFLPTNGQLFFSVRSFGAGLSEAEVVARYSLSPSTRFDGKPISQAAFGYADEFEITSFQNGVETVYLASLDAALLGTVVKQSEGATTRAGGMKIKIAVSSLANLRPFNDALWVYRHFKVKPQLIGRPIDFDTNGPDVLARGTGWRVTSYFSGDSMAVMGDVAFPIEDFLVSECAFPQISYGQREIVELDLPPNALDVASNNESLVFSDRTKAALKSAFENMIAEVKSNVEIQLAAARNIWDAKRIYGDIVQARNPIRRFQSVVHNGIRWQGFPVGNYWFDIPFNSGINLSRSEKSNYTGFTHIRTYRRVSHITPTQNSVVVFNDLSTKTASPARVKKFFEDNPAVQYVYVLTFDSDAVRDKFIADNHFQTVPVLLLSTLAKPASMVTVRASAKTPFDPSRHFEQRPESALVRAYFDGHADFDALELWARSVDLDKVNWPDFKRFYKHIELRVWPFATRSRWGKSEADLPLDSPAPGERELIALGLLIGRLAQTEERDNRNQRVTAATSDGPTPATLAYMMRRATRLVGFLRDTSDLSPSRRAWLAPLVAGMLRCPGGLAFATREKLVEHEELGARPDLIERLWNDPTLAIPILKWARDWLLAREVEVRATPAHIEALLGDREGFELALRLLPPLLESGAVWPVPYSLDDLARALEAASDNTTFQAPVLSLFARFPQLGASDDWLRTALGTVTQAETGTFDWAARWVQIRARNSDFALVPLLSAPLQEAFNAELVAAFPGGLSADQWRTLIALSFDAGASFAPSLLALALAQLPLSPEVAVILWALPGQPRAAWIAVLGEAKFNEAFAATIEMQAGQLDFDFALSLSPAQQEMFFAVWARDAGGLSVAGWQQLGALGDALDRLSTGLARLPIGQGFWEFFGALPAQERAVWLERVGQNRAARAFQSQSAARVAGLLDGDTQGLEALLDAWIEANLSALSASEEAVLRLATGDNTAWREAALSHLSRQPLSLPVALRLIESGLPGAQTLGRQFFEQEAPDWSERVLALCDSPSRAARREALELLARFPARWTPDLLAQLAQHDDPLVQAFVAARLAMAPQNGAIVAFESAILNARGRSRRAKNSVQGRLSETLERDAAQLGSLLDATRNGAPRDRAWALGQLVRLKMAGADVGELQIGGAVSRSS